MPHYPTCIFCGKNDSPPDKEELVAKWIARVFPNSYWEITNLTSGQVIGARNHFGVVTRKPCRRCNNGWMSHLESLAQPILTPMLHGTPSILTPSDQLTLAKWCMKFAVVYEIHSEEKSDYFFTAADCHNLFKASTVPFQDTFIYLAHYDVTPEHLQMTESRRAAYSADANRQPLGFEHYTITFAIKQLALQVFTFRRTKDMGVAPIRFDILGRWDEATIRIWPIEGDVAWPPPFSFDRAAFNIFADRWRTLNITV